MPQLLRRDSSRWCVLLLLDLRCSVSLQMTHQIAAFHAVAGRSIVSVSQKASEGAALAALAR
jgi:hypothetical protein